MPVFFELMLIQSLPKIQIRSFVLSCIILGCLSGCTGRQGAVYESLKAGLIDQQSAIDRAVINPNFRYLRAELAGRPALLVLGYVDEGSNGSIESWYSANQELIQIRDGRLVGTAGLDFNWTSVRYSEEVPLERALSIAELQAITLSSAHLPLDKSLVIGVLPGNQQKLPVITYQRRRTLMPGYRAQIEETIFLEPLNEPPSEIPSRDLARLSLDHIRWVQERVRPKAVDPHNLGLDPLPAYYALDVSSTPARVVYGRQCLIANYCLSWQLWPIPKRTAL